MTLLKDDELIPLAMPPDPMIIGLAPPVDYSLNSSVQPASVDLHIGSIYIPRKNRDEPGGYLNPLSAQILKPGGTAVIVTQEELRLPPDIAAFGFPPSSVSFHGILMTNPGHVDPGYVGRLRFTVINMGHDDYPFREGDRIVTLLFVRLSSSCTQSWIQRHGGVPAGPPTEEDINRLSADFLQIKNRAKTIAEEAVRKAELRIKTMQWLVPALVTLMIALITTFSAWLKPWQEPLESVRRDIAALQKTADLSDMKIRLAELERRLPALPSIRPGASSAPQRKAQ